MTSDTAETPTWRQPEMLADVEVCLQCFNLRGSFEGKEHRCDCVPRDDEWKEREWGRYDIAALVDLCHLCARNTMKSGTRWSWYACDSCLEVNRIVGDAFGSRRAGALPLGRHSIMNGVSLGGGDYDDAAVHGFAELLRGLTSVWKKIFEWAPAEAGRLAATAGWDSRAEAVPLVEWFERFPASRGASVDAFCRFVEYDLIDTEPRRSGTRSAVSESATPTRKFFEGCSLGESKRETQRPSSTRPSRPCVRFSPWR